MNDKFLVFFKMFYKPQFVTVSVGCSTLFSLYNQVYTTLDHMFKTILMRRKYPHFQHSGHPHMNVKHLPFVCVITQNNILAANKVQHNSLIFIWFAIVYYGFSCASLLRISNRPASSAKRLFRLINYTAVMKTGRLQRLVIRLVSLIAGRLWRMIK